MWRPTHRDNTIKSSHVKTNPERYPKNVDNSLNWPRLVAGNAPFHSPSDALSHWLTLWPHKHAVDKDLTRPFAFFVYCFILFRKFSAFFVCKRAIKRVITKELPRGLYGTAICVEREIFLAYWSNFCWEEFFDLFGIFLMHFVGFLIYFFWFFFNIQYHSSVAQFKSSSRD